MVGRVLLRVLLQVLGALLKLGSLRSDRFRAQITTDLVIEVASADGVAHHYVFRRADRSMSSRRGRAPGRTDVALEFSSAFLGFRTLIRTDAIGVIMQLLQARRATYTGNATYVLWFWGLTRMVLPLGRARSLKVGYPGALTTPNPHSKVADRITREPVATELDPQWAQAGRARAQMGMMRGSRGEDIPLW